MMEIKGLLEDFRQAKGLFLTTFSDEGERSRPMSNFNENPHEMM